jgi:hypothetical protein
VSRLVVPVVVEGWQYECCGEAPAVGRRVSWRLVLQQTTWSAAAVDLPVVVEPLGDREHEEWERLGNDPGPDPALARHGGLTVFVPDVGRLGGGRIRGVLQEDRHVDAPTGVPSTSGTITRVRLVSRQCRRVSRRSLHSVPGTEELIDVAAAPASLPYDAAPETALLWRHTPEVLVDLEVDPG